MPSAVHAMLPLAALLAVSFPCEAQIEVDGVCKGPASSGPYLRKTLDVAVYDKYERPGSRSGRPDTIEVQFYLTQMNEVDERLGQVTIGGYFRTYWTDTRLAYNSTAAGGCLDRVSLSGEESGNGLWKPDLYIDNLVEEKSQSSESLYFISPDGSVWHSQQVIYTVKCTMRFGRLPFDTQECMLKVGSYGMDTSQVRVLPKNGQIGPGSSGVGIKMDDAGLISPVWSMRPGQATRPGDVETLNFGPNLDWDYLYLRWSFDRKPGYFFSQALVPDAIFLLISYSASFVDAHAAPARAAMAILPVLVTVTLSNSVHSGLPQISDAMWISDYLLASLLLSCLAAIHFSVVQFCLLIEKTRQTKLQNLLSIEKAAKDVIKKARSNGTTLLELLDQIHPDEALLASGGMQCAPSMDDRHGSRYTASIMLSGTMTLDEEALPDSTPQGAEATGPDEESPFPVVLGSTPQGEETKGPDAQTSVAVNLSRSATFSACLNIKEADLLVIMWIYDLFIKIDKRHTNQLRPRDIRRLLWKFNLYWTEDSTAKVMCMFLRDHNASTPEDETNATISLGLFIEFLIEVSHYSLAVRHHASFSYSYIRSLAPSELCDVLMRCIFPWLFILKTVFFMALIDKYP